MKNKKAYIIGKISGLPLEEVKQNFDIKRKHLESLGYTEVLDPIEVFDEYLESMEIKRPTDPKEEWQLAMAASINAITAAKSFGDSFEIHPLPNFRDSQGCAIELDLAQKLGINVVFPRFTVRHKVAKTPENVPNTTL